MGLAIYQRGDTLYYPDPFRKSPKTMTVIDRRIYFHKSGKIFIRYLYAEILDLLIEEMHQNVKEDLDNVMCIYGAEGSGKSNLAYRVAKTYNPNFDMQKSYAVGFKDLLEKIHDYDGEDDGAVFWLDEATAIGNKREWMKSDNTAFMKLLQMFRSRHWLLILCIPDVNDLDIYLRKQRVRYELHCEWLDWEYDTASKRGYFELTRVDVKSRMKARKVVGYGKYDKIEIEENKEYLELKKTTQDDELQDLYESKQSKDKTKKDKALQRKMILRMKEVEGMSVAEIAAFTGLSEQTIMNSCTKARKERDAENE